MGKIAPQ
jgi:hypothetical protein